MHFTSSQLIVTIVPDDGTIGSGDKQLETSVTSVTCKKLKCPGSYYHNKALFDSMKFATATVDFVQKDSSSTLKAQKKKRKQEE